MGGHQNYIGEAKVRLESKRYYEVLIKLATIIKKERSTHRVCAPYGLIVLPEGGIGQIVIAMEPNANSFLPSGHPGIIAEVRLDLPDISIQIQAFIEINKTLFI